MDGGAWWAAVHGVAKSQTGLTDLFALFTFMHWKRKWQPTPVFLPGESQGRGSLVGCRLWGCTESDTTEVTWQHIFSGSMVPGPPCPRYDGSASPAERQRWSWISYSLVR